MLRIPKLVINFLLPLDVADRILFKSLSINNDVVSTTWNQVSENTRRVGFVWKKLH